MAKKWLIISILLFLICSIGFLIISQSYPIAFVNWQPISLKSFQKDSKAAINYYQKMLETYNKNDTALINSSEIRQEIKRAVLDRLIEDKLIQQELMKRLKDKELEKMVDDKIEEAMKGSDIKKGVEVLYGLSLDEFKERLLKPQAKQEILESRLLLENKNFDEWLKDARNQAKVLIFLPNFKWNGNEVKIK